MSFTSKVETKEKAGILINEYYSYIFTVAFSFVKNTESAKDLTHDSIVALMAKYVCNIKKEEIISPMTKSIIYTVVRSKAVKYMPNYYHSYYKPSNDITYDDECRHNRLINIIATKLSLKYSEVIILKHVYYLDNKTCANILDIKLSTFEKRLQKARKILEKLLRSEGYYEG